MLELFCCWIWVLVRKRCIHFVKIHEAVYFVISQQKWIKPCIYYHLQSCLVDSFEYLGVISFIQKKKRCLWLPIWNSYISFLTGWAPTFRNMTNQSGDRGIFVLPWLFGGHFISFNYKNDAGYWFERIFYQVTCLSIPILLLLCFPETKT